MKGKLIVFLVILLSFSAFTNVYSQIREEKEEKPLEQKRLPRRAPTHKLRQSAGVYIGYETNPLLATDRKGDVYEEFLYSADFYKPLGHDFRLTIDYDLDVTNYNEFTDISSILNHIQVGINKKFPICYIGTGYDAGIVNYSKSDSDFIFHKGFIYFGNKTSKRIYQKIQFEIGRKDYFTLASLGDALGTTQQKDRLDRRLAGEYSLSARVTPNSMLRLKTKFSHNDSNARFVDFYDWISWKQTISFNHKLYKDLFLLSNLSYKRKEYDSRTIAGGTKEQRDNLYTASLGFRKLVNKNNAVTLQYTYRENVSNERLEEYSESEIACGWQYNF